MLYRVKRLFLTVILSLFTTIAVVAQISGAVVDAVTGDSIPSATVSYKAQRVTTIADSKGCFKIDRHNGWNLSVSAVGYKTLKMKIGSDIPSVNYKIQLIPNDNKLGELLVKSKKGKYSRKNNPAVELMKRVIAAKKTTNLKNKSYYRYTKYSKTTLALNNISSNLLEKEGVKKRSWLNGQIEVCEKNGLLIMPFLVQEKVTEEIYRKEPQTEKTKVLGEKASGINELMQTADIATIMSNDTFTPVDLYDNQVRLLRQYFLSPIANDAISFYRYYIVDTVKIDRDSCIHLSFLPNNQQDIGFRGDIYVVNDKTLHLKKARFGLPRASIINFVNNIEIDQEYQRIGLQDDWVLSKNDMFIELSLVGQVFETCVMNTARYYDYSFAKIDDKEFKGKGREIYAADSQRKDDAFWREKRGDINLTAGENHTSSFLDGLRASKGFGWAVWVLKAFIENFIETSPTGKPSYFDIGPVNTIVSFNDIDKFRMRIGGQTTANLHRHLFLKGYYAHGFSTKKNYYNAVFTYAIDPKKYLPTDYPRNNISFETAYDICNPSDKFVTTDKDNVFTSLRWTNTQNMMFYNRQKLSYVFEQQNGFKLEAYAKCEENEAAGALMFKPLSEYDKGVYDGRSWNNYFEYSPKGLHNGKIRTTEFNVTIEYSPGAKFFSTKQRTRAVNRDVPIFTISHTLGIKGLLGGQYNYNVTEAKIYKRFNFSSWGSLTCHLKGGVQWSQVPYPLLIAPAANLSYMSAPSAETFNLVNGAEFMNDRYVSLMLEWKMNGKLFNRIPLLKRLKLREYLAVKTLWGALSDKNNPTLQKNWESPVLMAFPEGYNVMNPKVPYVEGTVGIHNLFRIFNIDYVHRFNYNHLPTASRHGIRFSFEFTF